jgi:hypothetical protein
VSHYIALLFIVTGSVFAQSETGMVSVEELRNPLKGDSMRAIVTAQKHLKSGQHDRGMQELREALNDPVAMPYAISTTPTWLSPSARRVKPTAAWRKCARRSNWMGASRRLAWSWGCSSSSKALMTRRQSNSSWPQRRRTRVPTCCWRCTTIEPGRSRKLSANGALSPLQAWDFWPPSK